MQHFALIMSLFIALLGGQAARAQDVQAAEGAPSGEAAEPLALTLAEAIDIALNQNYAIRNNLLDVANADAQVREAWGAVLPSVDASGSYTRNVKTANPFAGSDVSSLFGGSVPTDWLGFNEQARTDDDPSTQPIPLQEFQQRQQQGRREAGVSLGGGSGNPFGVANQFQGGLRITQALYNGTAFAAIEGAQALKDVNQLALDRQQQVVIRDVRQAFYQTLLAQQQADVAVQSVQRTRQTLQEVGQQVRRGVVPKMQRLSTEVQLANQQTQLVQARNQAATAVDNFKMQLGIPVAQPIELQGELDADNMGRFLQVSTQEALEVAVGRRPDLLQALQAIQLRQVQQNVTRAQYFPSVSAFADFNYSGRVPDDRTEVTSPPNDPFTFDQTTNDFFSRSYWNPSVSVGLQINWNLFNGFQTTARIQQDQVAINRARLQYEQLRESVRLEVEQALRNLESARSRITSQQENVERAELAFEFAQKRLSVGESSRLVAREASEQLDTARLNYLQAVYDYLAAKSDFETSIGMPLPGRNDLLFTSTE